MSPETQTIETPSFEAPQDQLQWRDRGFIALRLSMCVEFVQEAWQTDRERARMLREVDPSLGWLRRLIRNRTNLESDILLGNNHSEVDSIPQN